MISYMHIYNRRQLIMSSTAASLNKKRLIREIKNYLLVAVGTLILAFGSVIFLSKSELVAGGVSGIAIIINHFVEANVYDYAVAGLTILFWVIGLIFVGKDFAMKSLFSSVLYIGYTFLFNRIELFDNLANTFAGLVNGNTELQVGNLILCGLFGGVFVGAGVAVTFVGGGSTGGVDCFQPIFRKYFGVREPITSFVVDAVVIVAGMLAMKLWIPALCGILSCVMSALLIEAIYIRSQTSFQVDIISKHWEEINNFAINELDRGATIIKAEGGYKREERVILRIVFDRSQYEKLRDFIAIVDPDAFITFTQTNAVYGEGFSRNRKRDLKKKK